jgi:DNA-directed RNA polymerase subunit RPC12/RpoP
VRLVERVVTLYVCRDCGARFYSHPEVACCDSSFEALYPHLTDSG